MDFKKTIQPEFASINENILPLQKGLRNDFYGLLSYINVIALLIIVTTGLVNTDYFYSFYVFYLFASLLAITHFYLYRSKNITVSILNMRLLSRFWNTLYVDTISPVVKNNSKPHSKNRKANTNATVFKDANAKTPSNTSSSICFIVSSLFLFCCLINLKIFINNGLFNYFAFVLGSGTILTILLVYYSRRLKERLQITITLSLVLFLVWALFVFIQAGIATQYKYNRIAVCFLFFISFIVLRKDNCIAFYKAVTFIAGLEGVWCILQYLDKIPTENLDFDVTGSFVNPNVVAMFMALSLPAVLYLCFNSKNVFLKVTYYLILLIVCLGLLLLECRTAILGGFFSSSLFALLYFNVFKRWKRKYLFIGLLFIGLLSIPIGRQLYNHKKDSADGRILIWRLTTQMIQDAPLRGYGTGMFEKEYNLKQAKAIQERKLSKKEMNNASFVLMAYNDYLEQAVQGGIPALVVFILMLASFLFFPKKSDNLITENSAEENSNGHYVAYTGIAGFALMSVFNFTISAIPVLLLFCMYAGILCANTKQPKLVTLSIKPPIAKTILLTLACIPFYITYTQLNQAKAHRQIKRSQDFLASGNLREAEILLSQLQESQQNSVSFCMVYGNLLFAQQKYKEALYQFDYAKKFSANPVLYNMTAQCNFQLKDNKEAIENLYLLTALSPKTMKYKFGLMQVLIADKQIKQACGVAQQIVKMQVINPNELTDDYLKQAKIILK